MDVYNRGFLRLEDRLDEEDRSDRLMLLPHVCQDGVCVCVRMCVYVCMVTWLACVAWQTRGSVPGT